MKHRFLPFITVSLLALVLVAGGCAGATVTVTLPRATIPGATITLPGSTTTLPAVTVTLPGSVTTIVGSVVTVPPIVETIPPNTISAAGFLPTTPITITTHAGLLDSLKGACLTCHGAGEENQYPMAPSWNGAGNGSSHNTGVYAVVAGSMQDHTGRVPKVYQDCSICHPIAKS